MHATRPIAATNHLTVHVLPELPPLAWLASLSGPQPALLCGSDVETFGNSGFFEGCWAGDFDAQDFDRARHVFGSGARITDRGALFVTPSHTLDALYVLQRDGGFVVANSLPFLAQFAGLELPYDFSIGSRFVSLRNGLEAYERVVFRGPDWTLHRIAYENFEIHGQEIRRRPKLPAREGDFDDYESYRDFVLGTLDRVMRNGSSPSRKRRYPLITSCSSGYDSTACTALAATLGCRQVLTLSAARGFHAADSGRRAAEALGMEPIELERPSRARGAGFEEAEFFATGMGGEDFVFKGFAPYCARKILLTGFHGDISWDRNVKPANDLTRKDVSGSTLSELRLRQGFVNMPVAFIGATRHDVLLRVSCSEEMRPYQVGGRYDRPIPRRIAEEKGVPRDAFGRSKKGNSITFGYLARFWSEATIEDLRRFERRILAEQGIGASYYARWAAQTGAQLALVAVGKPAGRIGLAHIRNQLFKRIPGADTLRYRHARYSSMATLWAIDKIRARYPTQQAWLARQGSDGEGTVASIAAA